ncbi:U3-containing 90S pre-ribosomal complex subunit-domain containing protein [Filobasidium floriforme]|uniref:U3-containing 90S pre-ribosomal complex subunit-domain containing protein n=1 Tax=Filobasidium floriforme TaxID=5210 RepID=UPI001E8ED49B|nr:U3-containing 90S pre-ribosomal complex subunit-domain containing protein [Filobasidium floriforme]KAH8090598.1 U3-containing 90S pre-ribosomal complex subunit-domain containing protein [Filobasidium floriforme]
MTTEELDNFFYDSLKATYSKASDMELNDLRIPANVLQSTSAFTEPRELASLPAFVNSQIPSLPKRLKRAGTPSLIVLSPSGIRAADVVRALKSVRVPEGEDGAETGKPPGEVGKLFAKHFKASEQIEYLNSTKIWAAAGTPGRIGKILSDSDALTIRQQTVILLDLSYRDTKNRTLLTIPEIRDEFWKVLFGDKKVREKLLATGVKIAVF